MVSGDADIVAEKMLKAINIAAWDSLPIIKWTFRESHHYVWDKVSNTALVTWDDYVVHLNMDNIDGKVFLKGVIVEEKLKNDIIKKAWKYWCNDSYWLYAPAKIFDPGTTRRMAIDKTGKEGLLVTYEHGGVTPGDQYLWFTNSQGLPAGYKMWVGIIPVGGVYASFDNWQKLPGGALVATQHTFSLAGAQVNLTNVVGGHSWADVGYDENPIKL